MTISPNTAVNIVDASNATRMAPASMSNHFCARRGGRLIPIQGKTGLTHPSDTEKAEMTKTLPTLPQAPQALGYTEYARLPNNELRVHLYRAAAEIELILSGEIVAE